MDGRIPTKENPLVRSCPVGDLSMLKLVGEREQPERKPKARAKTYNMKSLSDHLLLTRIYRISDAVTI